MSDGKGNSYGPYLETAVNAARAAGRIQRSRLGSTIDIRMKGEADLVTEVDLACEAAIKEIVEKDWPGHAVLGEEGGTSGKGEFLWIVDPLDGTTNYAHAYPHFCCSVALKAGDDMVAGAVYDPMRDELFTATAGGGAFLNGKPILVSTIEVLENSMLSTGFPYPKERRIREAIPLFDRVQSRIQAIRRDGSAALNLCYVAAGRFDGFWEISLHAWDVSAGWLIIEEAGGKISGFDGSPTDVFSGEIVATNGLIHEDLINLLS